MSAFLIAVTDVSLITSNFNLKYSYFNIYILIFAQRGERETEKHRERQKDRQRERDMMLNCFLWYS